MCKQEKEMVSMLHGLYNTIVLAREKGKQREFDFKIMDWLISLFSSAGYGEQNPAFANRGAGNYLMPEPPTTPGPFPPGLSRNEGTIPGVGAAMPLSLPSIDTNSQGEQKQAHPSSMPSGAPPLPPGPHPSQLGSNQPQGYHNPQQMPQQGHPQQMPSFPQPPPNMPQIQPPSHMPLLPHPHMHRPPQMPPHNMPSNIPSSMPGSMPMPPSSVSMSMPGPMVIGSSVYFMLFLFCSHQCVYLLVSFCFSVNIGDVTWISHYCIDT